MDCLTTGMSLDEQIGQLFMVGFWGTTPSQEILDLIRRYHVGGIIFFSRNIQHPQQVLALTQSLQSAAKDAGYRYPLLIAIDQENGMVQRLGPGTTVFPGNMALGAIDSEQTAYEVALAVGAELKALGVNMNLAPVVDVNNNPANPVIGVRSFGEDPHKVARLGAAMIKGYRSAGVISTLKHFPGHGDTSVDSHLALPTISHTMERLESMELVPFKSGIEAGADCVMTAHVYFPSITPDEALPATVAPAVVRGLLREKLGFAGIIISDCLEMNAIAETIGVEKASITTLQAGTDLVLVSHLYPRQKNSIEAVRSAVQSGELSSAVIQQAAERILRLKQRLLSWDNLPAATVPALVGGEMHQQLRDQAYNISTTLVRNDAALLPLRLAPDERILILTQPRETISKVEDREYSVEALVQSVQQYHEHVNTLVTSPRPTREEYERIQQAINGADVIIMVTINAYLDQQQTRLMQSLLETDKHIIGIAVGIPYDLLAFPELRTYLVTYEYTQPALDAAVRVLFGAIQPQGRLPVSLPGLYPMAGSKL